MTKLTRSQKVKLTNEILTSVINLVKVTHMLVIPMQGNTNDKHLEIIAFAVFVFQMWTILTKYD